MCIQTWLWAFSSWFSRWHCLRACLSASSAWARWAFSRHFWEYCSDNTSSSLWMDCSSSLDIQSIITSTRSSLLMCLKRFELTSELTGWMDWLTIHLSHKYVVTKMFSISQVTAKTWKMFSQNNVLVLYAKLINVRVQSTQLGALGLLQILLVRIFHSFNSYSKDRSPTFSYNMTLLCQWLWTAEEFISLPAIVAAVSSAKSLSRSSRSLEISLWCCLWMSSITLWCVSSIAANPRSHVAYRKKGSRLCLHIIYFAHNLPRIFYFVTLGSVQCLILAHYTVCHAKSVTEAMQAFFLSFQTQLCWKDSELKRKVFAFLSFIDQTSLKLWIWEMVCLLITKWRSNVGSKWDIWDLIFRVYVSGANMYL